MQLPEADRYTHSKPFIESQIAILMGGRVAEELFLRQMTSGASNDIERATELARKMVCELGMSPLGPVHFQAAVERVGQRFARLGLQRGNGPSRGRRDSDRWLMRGYETSRQIIERQRAAVKALAVELLEVESVDADRLRQILAEHVVPAAPISQSVREALTEASC
jgi:cell division protease FtsH